jgi:hypothetical protein
MNKISIVLTWPCSCDYPLWRQFLRDNRSLFDEVIISFTETYRGYDYRKFIIDAMNNDNCIFVDSSIATYGDWRNASTNNCLSVLHNPQYVWFTEQDFFVKEGFWNWVNNRNDDVICVKTENRIHPCCIFMKADKLNTTKKDFSAKSNRGLDHFGLLQEDIERLSMSVAIIPRNYYEHMAGVSHNFHLIISGESPCYKSDEFCDYLRRSLLVNVPLHEEFIKIANKAIEQYWRKN